MKSKSLQDIIVKYKSFQKLAENDLKLKLPIKFKGSQEVNQSWWPSAIFYKKCEPCCGILKFTLSLEIDEASFSKHNTIFEYDIQIFRLSQIKKERPKR